MRATAWVLVVPLAALVGCSSSSPKPHSVSPTTCIAGNSAFLLAAQLPGSFVVIHDQPLQKSPRATHYLPIGPTPLAISTWKAGHLRGWIATVAVDGPDRPAEDAVARSLGYAVGKFPGVPLIGPVVEHNSGVLEVYETVNLFGDATGARDWMTDVTDTAHGAETNIATDAGVPVPKAMPLSIHGADDAVGYEMPPWVEPRFGQTERTFVVAALENRYVVQVNVQGGSAVTVAVALPLVNRTLERLSAACMTPMGGLSVGSGA